MTQEQTDKPAFTPGPWHVGSLSDPWAVYATVIGPTGPTERLVADVGYGEGHGPANAHLIAAAPLLYEACEAALLIDESVSPSVDPEEIFAGIRAALAAARGES